MNKFVGRYVAFSVRRHKVVVFSAIALLLVAGLVASRLTMDSRLEGIVPADRPTVIAYQQVDEEFGGNDKVFVVVKDGGDAGAAYVEALAARLASDNLDQGLFYKVDMSFMERYGFLFLPTDLYQQLEEKLDDPRQAVEFLLASLNHEAGPIDTGYLSSENLHLMMLRPGAVIIDPVGRDIYFSSLQMAIDETLASSPKFAAIEAGYTGGQMVLDYQGDMIAFEGFLSTALLTFVIIIAIVILSFRRLGVPLATGLPLMLGTILTCALTVLVYGTINIFSVAFAVLLLGLGIDFAIHILTRYGEERAAGRDVEEALTITLQQTGAGMFTGALTTAAAFGMFAFGEFTALRQMGIISATGIMLALVSMLGVMPAIIAWADDRGEAKTFKNVEYRFFGPLTKRLVRHRFVVLGLLVLVIVVLYPTFISTKINADFTSLFPDNLPAIYWLDVLQQDFDYDPDSVSLVASGMDDLLALRAQLLDLPSVQQVESVLDFLPEDQEYKLEVLTKLRQTFASPAAQQALSALPPDLLQALHALGTGVGELRPITLQDLPDAITMNFVGKSGKLLLEVTAEGDIWDEVTRDNLAKELATVYADAPAGMPYLMRDVVELIKADVLRVSLLAGLVIFAILFWAFRSVPEVLLAMVPAAGGMYLVLGLRELFGYDINIFSIMILPLIIGIGVDNGVHLIHRTRHEGLDALPNVLTHIGKAVTTTTLTTLVGFGSLMFVNHPALSSIGQAVAIGMSLCLILTVVVLPALIPLTMRRVNTETVHRQVHE